MEKILIVEDDAKIAWARDCSLTERKFIRSFFFCLANYFSIIIVADSVYVNLVQISSSAESGSLPEYYTLQYKIVAFIVKIYLVLQDSGRSIVYGRYYSNVKRNFRWLPTSHN